eukprot:4072807-Amphidinium_carterae.1
MLLVELFQRLLGGESALTLLIEGGHRAFIAMFEEARKYLLLDDSPFTLSTLRGGGAIWQIQHCQSLAILQWKGRWSSEEFVRRVASLGSAYGRLEPHSFEPLPQWFEFEFLFALYDDVGYGCSGA